MSKHDKGLTVKQRKFIDVYLKTGSATDAAWESYDCKNREVAGEIGYQLLKKLDFGALMESAGLTDQLLVQKALEGLDAHKLQRDYDTGEVMKVADFSTRHKYLKTSAELKGRAGSKESNVNVQVNNILDRQRDEYNE